MYNAKVIKNLVSLDICAQPKK